MELRSGRRRPKGSGIKKKQKPFETCNDFDEDFAQWCRSGYDERILPGRTRYIPLYRNLKGSVTRLWGDSGYHQSSSFQSELY